MNNGLKQRIFSQETAGKLSDDGYWTLTVEIKERDTLDGINWREERVVAQSIDTSFDDAHKTALRSVLQQMNSIVYSRGFDSLIDAVESLKEATDEQVATKETNSN